MIYLDENDLKNIDFKWDETIDCIKKATFAFNNNDYSQPLKPYLRYKNLENRIIAMPAYVGSEIDTAGIKWVASFPSNIEKNIPRAHSVVILNNANTGKPICIINTALLSVIRTASITGLMLKEYIKFKNPHNLTVGIIGWGPIGQSHFSMIKSIMNERIDSFYLYDKRPIVDRNSSLVQDDSRVNIANNWTELYLNSDIVITCTTSPEPYINLKPKKGALLLNISLRDYKTDIYDYVKDSIIVDNWEEVCRESTDIETLFLKKGLQENMVKTLSDVVCNNCLADYSPDTNIMFNPMGMSIYDISIGKFFMDRAKSNNIGTIL